MIDEYGTQIFVNTDPPDPNKIDPVRNTDPVAKPEGGLWTSSLRNGTSAWVDWVRRENYSPHPISEIEVWRLEPVNDPNLYVIDSLEDFQLLLSKHGLNDDTLFNAIDYEEVADDYDGIWVTKKGQAETRFSEPSLYGFDCESTIWFDWCFENIEESIIEIAE